LFGDLPGAMTVPTPKIPNAEPWTLTELLNNEKEVTGMFMSGHPLDHFKFELKHYEITNIADFNEAKDAIALQLNPGRMWRVAGLVTDVQHRVTKTGKNFGSFVMEDYSGKTEYVLWSEDYVKFQNYLEKGQNILLNGFFRNRFNQPNVFEFKINTMSLLETVKQNLTRTVEISMHPSALNASMLQFLEKNWKSNPGKSTLKFNVYEPKENLRISMYTIEKGFLMNEEMADFLMNNPDVDVRVGLVG
jgi:DNA polymerase-3 subunit alpha